MRASSLLEKLFERQLDGHPLAGQIRDSASVRWLNFRTVTNRRWHDGKIVLAGDAAHTTHYSIGWGTKLAIEDVIALAENVQHHDTLEMALQSYETQRYAALLPPQGEARLSAQWFENISRYIDLEPHQFAMLLHGRRSPILPHVTPRLYYQLLRATEEIAVLRELRRRVGPKAKAIYGRRNPTDEQFRRSWSLRKSTRTDASTSRPPDELGSAEIAAWHSMQRATPSLANPFLSPEFAVAVGRTRPNAQVAILMEGQSITGFFPFERRRLGMGVPIGGWLSQYQGLIHAPGAEWEPRELFRGMPTVGLAV